LGREACDGKQQEEGRATHQVRGHVCRDVTDVLIALVEVPTTREDVADRHALRAGDDPLARDGPDRLRACREHAPIGVDEPHQLTAQVLHLVVILDAANPLNRTVVHVCHAAHLLNHNPSSKTVC
jgi:hypothetical protein